MGIPAWPLPPPLCGIPVSGGWGAQEGSFSLNCVPDLSCGLGFPPLSRLPTWQEFPVVPVVTPGPNILGSFLPQRKLDGMFYFPILKLYGKLFFRWISSVDNQTCILEGCFGGVAVVYQGKKGRLEDRHKAQVVWHHRLACTFTAHQTWRR